MLEIQSLLWQKYFFIIKEFVNDEFDTDFLEKKLFPLIIKSTKDKISNVRMNAATVIKKMMRHSKSRDILREIQTSIDELKRDTDIDVVNSLNDN